MDCCNHNLTIKKEDDKLYQCPECGLWYNEKEWAEKCRAWCKEHKSCNLEIISHSVVPYKINQNH